MLTKFKVLFSKKFHNLFIQKWEGKTKLFKKFQNYLIASIFIRLKYVDMLKSSRDGIKARNSVELSKAQFQQNVKKGKHKIRAVVPEINILTIWNSRKWNSHKIMYNLPKPKSNRDNVMVTHFSVKPEPIQLSWFKFNTHNS